MHSAAARLTAGKGEPEHLRTKRLRNAVAAIAIQRIARGWLVRMKMKLWREAVVVLQRWWRYVVWATAPRCEGGRCHDMTYGVGKG